MEREINVALTGKMAFTADIDGQKVTVDAGIEFGGEGKGPGPKSLIMVSIAGCSGMDVVSLLEKMRVSYTSLNIKVQSVIADEHPKKYEKIKIIYELTGSDIDIEKVDKAVKLSEEKYCGVWATLKPSVDISYEIKIN
jgi:putative redox protein